MRRGSPSVHALLDVPYVSQTPELCGGAAVAMVLRYWGERGVFPQDFAPLVSAGDGGILTGALASAVRDRGWQALVVPAGDDSRPRADPIGDRPGPAPHRAHRGWTPHLPLRRDRGQHRPGGGVARSGARALSGAALGRIRPRVDGHRTVDDAGASARRSPAWRRRGAGRHRRHQMSAVHADQTPCGALVERSVQMALTGDRRGGRARAGRRHGPVSERSGLVAGAGGVAILAVTLVRGAGPGAFRRASRARRRVRVAARRDQSIPDGRPDGGARRLEPHGRAAHRHDRHSRRGADAAAGRRSGRRAATPTGADA